MSHVPPHRWADALAGRLEDHEVRAIERHVEQCTQCTRARDRVQRASDSFTAIKNAPAPELPWDSVRARIHWSVSTERRERIKAEDTTRRRRWIAPTAFGLVAAGVLAYAVVAPPLPTTRPATVVVPTASPVRDVPAPVVVAAAPLVGLVNRATGDVMINGIVHRDLFARDVVAGNVIVTNDSRVDVQFGEASAFAVGPSSTLTIEKFDAGAIELRVEGTVDIVVAPRATHQTFVVHAGKRRIEVRGTQFRVHHDDTTTTVACRHGLVAVRDEQGKVEVEVGAERRIVLATVHAVAPERMQSLSVDEVADLARTTPYSLPAWDLLAQNSAPLEIATVGLRDVRVDGVEHGHAPMRLRVLPGRHTVEAADHAGRFRRAGWIDVTSAKPARLEVPAEPLPTRNVNARRRQLQNGIDKARLAGCTRNIAKSGLRTDTFVQIEIAVDARGAINFLNIIDTDLPSLTASCVREALADVHFGPGGAANWQERIDL
jgi:FecR protein